MNYLSHFYIQMNNEPAFTLGKILPDLVRNYDKSCRIVPAQLEQPTEAILRRMYHGVMHHFKVDELFHHSSYFKKHLDMIKLEIHASGFAKYRKYIFFYAHVLLELMLDRILIKEEPQTANLFYDQLEKTAEFDLLRFFSYFVPQNKGKGFIVFFKQFISSRYLFDYRNNDTLIFALGRITERAGLPPFDQDEKDGLKNLIPKMEYRLNPEYLTIFEIIDKQLINEQF